MVEKTINNGFKSPNCLNTVRLLAALSVMYFHIIGHLEIDMPKWVSQIFSLFPGVPIFFFMSGFLIWNSVGRSRNFTEYIQKRFWRIYPQLWLAVIIGVIFIVILYEKPIEIGKMSLFTITQGTVLQFWTPGFLREYGCGTPNGALWTIGIMVQFYIVVYFVHKILYRKPWYLWIIIITVSLMVSFASPYLSKILPVMLYKLYNQTLIVYFWLFMLGSLVADKSEKILPFLKKWWGFFIGVAIIFLIFPQWDIMIIGYNLIYCVFQIFGLLGIAYSFPILNIKRDISYGIYVYHMIIVNVMIEFGMIGKIEYLVVAMFLAICVSYISEKTLGAFSLKRKQMIGKI